MNPRADLHESMKTDAYIRTIVVDETSRLHGVGRSGAAQALTAYAQFEEDHYYMHIKVEQALRSTNIESAWGSCFKPTLEPIGRLG